MVLLAQNCDATWVMSDEAKRGKKPKNVGEEIKLSEGRRTNQ